MSDIFDIDNVEKSYSRLRDQVYRCEHGMRAIAVMYDEHSADQFSKDNIYRLKDNIHYRFLTTLAQFELLMNETNHFNMFMTKRSQGEKDFMFNQIKYYPYTERISNVASSIFDSIIFQSVSAYDYLSHYISYIILQNKQKTVYWTKLAKSSYGKDNEVSKYPIKDIIQLVDKNLIKKLYDYRSDLIHNSYKKCKFSASITTKDLSVKLQLQIPEELIRIFSNILPKEAKRITSLYFSFNLIESLLENVELLLDGLRVEILNNTNWVTNISKPKPHSIMFAFPDPKTGFATPVSEVLWEEYKNWENRKQRSSLQ